VVSDSPSIARSVALYFILAGALTFGSLMLGVRQFATQFGDRSVEESLQGAAEDVADALEVDGDRLAVKLSSIEHWGYDALYGNLAYRVVNATDGNVLAVSAPDRGVTAITGLPAAIPDGFSDRLRHGMAVYRLPARLEDRELYVDVARSDRLGELAKEAVVPAVTEAALFSIVGALSLFLATLWLAVRRISGSLRVLSSDIADFGRRDSAAEITLEKIPVELHVLAQAFKSAVDDLLSSHEAQKRFAENAAHELKTPLTVARIAAETLSGVDNDARRDLISQIDISANMVERLLELSRAQSTSSYRLERICLSDTAGTAVDLLRPLAATRGVELRVRCPSPAFAIMGDKTAWIVALKNLVENALVHADGVTEVIITIQDDRITVENDGRSMDPAEKPFIFDRFFRGRRMTSRGSGGLGLSIVQQVVLAHGATIRHADGAPSGSIFTIQF
jgi:signal transduction histidine kinase